MNHHTYNFKSPDSLYHLKDSVICDIIAKSEVVGLTNKAIVPIIEAAGVKSRRSAKELAARVEAIDLSTIHNELITFKEKHSGSNVTDVCYDRERNYVTIKSVS